MFTILAAHLIKHYYYRKNRSILYSTRSSLKIIIEIVLTFWASREYPKWNNVQKFSKQKLAHQEKIELEA